MTLFWNFIFFLLLFLHSIRCDIIDSNASKSGERDDSSDSQSAFESNSYPTQSMHSSNGYSHQNSMPLSESKSSVYGSGHQNNDRFDPKERKTLILAIPMKLKLPKSEDNSDSDQMSDSESAQIKSESLLYSKSLPYQSSYPQQSRQPSSLSQNLDDFLPNPIKSASLPPLSHKIYPSIDSHSKSYSVVNMQKSVSEQSSGLGFSDQQYKNKDNQYVKEDYNQRKYPSTGDYKGLTFKSESIDSDFDLSKYRKPFKSEETLDSVDSYESRIKQKQNSKKLYETVPYRKPEYEYDSDSEADDEVDDERSVENIDFSSKGYQINIKNGFNPKNKKLNDKPLGSKSFISPQIYHNHKGIGQSMPIYTAEPFDGWPHHYYSKPILNDWTGIQGIPQNLEANYLQLLNIPKINQQIKESRPRNPLYETAFDILNESQLKASSNPIPMKTLENSKIYGEAAKYQSTHPTLNMFPYEQDYSVVNLNGDLYPAPLLAQKPPIKPQKPLLQKETITEYNSGNRDSIKPHRRIPPLLLRPSFMSGLRSGAKPLANYSPLASASTQSFLSILPSLPSLQTSFNINTKSIPRQIFPLFYG